ncbi:MAG: hypothetical protein HY506_01830 [Candidatus Yanofskybacteria bacterium]|nr:hypothetical protein [Candidatus Yanofskybacteria bacterium]
MSVLEHRPQSNSPGDNTDATRRLLEQPHIERIVRPDKDLLFSNGHPVREGLKMIPEKTREMAELLVSYLESPIIVDDFKDNDQRREWKTKELAQDQELLSVYKRNKLRANSVGSVLSTCETLIKHKKYAELYDNISVLKGKILGNIGGRPYKEMDIEEKITVANELSLMAKTVYDKLLA